MNPSSQQPTQNQIPVATEQNTATTAPQLASYAVPNQYLGASIVQPEQNTGRAANKYVIVLVTGLLVVFLVLAFIAMRQRNSVSRSASGKEVQDTNIRAVTGDAPADSVPRPANAPIAASGATQPAPKASTAPAPAATRASGQAASGFTCVSNETYAKHIDPGALKQAENSVKAAMSGGSAALTNWVPEEYSNKSPLNNPAEVDKSFRNAKPTVCNVEFAYSVNETMFSGRAIVFSLSYKGAQNKSYVSNINVANVSGVWKTFGISIIEATS